MPNGVRSILLQYVCTRLHDFLRDEVTYNIGSSAILARSSSDGILGVNRR